MSSESLQARAGEVRKRFRDVPLLARESSYSSMRCLTLFMMSSVVNAMTETGE